MIFHTKDASRLLADCDKLCLILTLQEDNALGHAIYQAQSVNEAILNPMNVKYIRYILKLIHIQVRIGIIMTPCYQELRTICIINV